MRKLFFLSGLVAVLSISAFLFSSCETDDSPNDDSPFRILATNVINGSNRIDMVKVITEDGDVIAQSPYLANGFTIELPAFVSDEYLNLISSDIPKSISVSDNNAKVLFISEILGFNESNREIGAFYLEQLSNDNEYYTIWAYSDRKLTIKGSGSEGPSRIVNFDVKLKKGWNVLYAITTISYNESSGLVTGEKPPGVSFQWRYY